jgi:hypothetical protein
MNSESPRSKGVLGKILMYPSRSCGRLVNPTKRLFISRGCYAQEDQNRTVQPDHILIGEAPYSHPHLSSWDGGDLVHHQSADRPQAVAFTWFDRDSQQWRIGRVGRKRAHRNRIGSFESVILNN